MKETLSVTFLNQPKLSEHKTDREINEKRISLVPQIEKFLLNHEMFKGKQIKVSFFHTGVSSLVSLLETSEGRCVLKILLRANAPKGEALFLRKWESIGISVPHVYGTGTIKNHSYLLMKYIPGQLLGEHTETDLLDRGVFHQMGGH